MDSKLDTKAPTSPIQATSASALFKSQERCRDESEICILDSQPSRDLVCPSILACTGFFVGTISNISPITSADQAYVADVPPISDFRTLVEESTFETRGYQSRRKLAIHLFFQAVHQSNERHQRFLHGRRFALLDNHTLYLVPRSASVDDSGYSFIGNLRMPLVLRPKDSELSHVLASSNNNIRLKMKSFEEAQISHCSLIGDLFIEEWMFGGNLTRLIERDSYAGKSWERPAAAKYDDWKRGQGKVLSLQIFALHQ